MRSAQFDGHGNITHLASDNGKIAVTFEDGHTTTINSIDDLDWLADVQTDVAHAEAVAAWKLRHGLLGQFFDWLTRGWFARVIQKDPRPSNPGDGRE